ncbi:hypothetical protein ScPMuIL_012177 [Solemya velum]
MTCYLSIYPSWKSIDTTYVDHAGTTLYARSQIEAVQKDLLSNVYGNPHSRSSSSTLTAEKVDQVRCRILRHFNTTVDDYSVVFTAGCTAALKLLAETFDFSSQIYTSADSKLTDEQFSTHLDVHEDSKDSRRGCFCYLLDNHTSVCGMREVVKKRVNSIICLRETSMSLEKLPDEYYLKKLPGHLAGNGLFVFPAQSNFSGRKYPLEWLEKVQQKVMGFQKDDCLNWHTVLDAAAFVSTSDLDLSCYKPDFVTISFYKMFGLPTGLGCLLVRNGSDRLLRKTYFGGGTVMVNCPKDWYYVARQGVSDRLEDGTVSFLDIIALKYGFEALQDLGGGMKRISEHTFCLAQYFHHQLSDLQHSNGTPLASLYCHDGFEHISTQGAIVNFNLKRSDGSYIGFAEVDKLAQMYDIHLRTGCFCNVGACQEYLGLTTLQIKGNFQAGHECGDDKDLINGQPTGSVRISFGYMSTWKDVETCLRFIRECFLEMKQTASMNNVERADSTVKYIKNISQNQVDANDVDSIPSAQPFEVLDNEDQPICENRCEQQFSKVSNVNLSAASQREEGMRKQTVGGSCQADGHVIGESKEKLINKKIFCDEVTALQLHNGHIHRLTNIYVYPIKSCAAFEVSQWNIGSRGLQYDREWVLISENKKVITQKQEPKLCLLQPQICLKTQTLILRYPGSMPLVVPLSEGGSTVREDNESKWCTSRICGDRVTGMDCGDEVARWLTKVFQRPIRLVRQRSGNDRSCKLKSNNKGSEVAQSSLSYANQSQYLLLSWPSLLALQQRMTHENRKNVPDLRNLASRFRGNLLVEGRNAFEEETLDHITIGNLDFFNCGSCTRCQMICNDPDTGQRNPDPLSTLLRWRGGKVPFGVYLTYSSTLEPGIDNQSIKVGDVVAYKPSDSSSIEDSAVLVTADSLSHNTS